MIAVLGAIVLLAASCGSSETPPGLGSDANPSAVGVDIEDILEDPQDAADELTDELGVDVGDLDDFGQFISLDDIEDFENPAVELGSSGNVTINIEGKTITAEADFIDGTAGDSTPIPGSFEATCP